jgi:hypothetical protein
MQDASKIFAATKKRDEMLFGYDAFGIILDTYKDNENTARLNRAVKRQLGKQLLNS